MPHSKRKSPPNNPPKQLPILLRHSWYGLNQAFRRRIIHLGLTPDQFTVLRNLAEEPGLTQRDLCVRMASDPNTVAALTARMAAEGWIERKVCQKDRRANRLRLLTPGRRKFNAARKIALGLQAEVCGFLSPKELDTFTETFARLAQACQTALKRSPSKSAGTKCQQPVGQPLLPQQRT